jgi:hypothetical protein
MCDGSSQHFVLTYLGVGQTRTTFAPLAAFARGTHNSNVFLSKVGGAVVREPRMWYLPSPDLIAGVGRPSMSVPMKAMFERRSMTTTSFSPGFSPDKLALSFSTPTLSGRKPGKASEIVLGGMCSAVLVIWEAPMT